MKDAGGTDPGPQTLREAEEAVIAAARKSHEDSISEGSMWMSRVAMHNALADLDQLRESAPPDDGEYAEMILYTDREKAVWSDAYTRFATYAAPRLSGDAEAKERLVETCSSFADATVQQLRKRVRP